MPELAEKLKCTLIPGDGVGPGLFFLFLCLKFLKFFRTCLFCSRYY